MAREKGRIGAGPTLLSSLPINSANLPIWASRPSSFGSPVAGKQKETLMVGRAGLLPHPQQCSHPGPLLSHQAAGSSLAPGP
jgi:hypothetical protein